MEVAKLIVICFEIIGFSLAMVSGHELRNNEKVAAFWAFVFGAIFTAAALLGVIKYF